MKKVNFTEMKNGSKEDYQLLEKLGNCISQKVVRISSEQRKSLHVAAVFVCNFVNHLYEIGNEICEANNVAFEVLHPLIQETAHKITELSEKSIHQEVILNSSYQEIQLLPNIRLLIALLSIPEMTICQIDIYYLKNFQKQKSRKFTNQKLTT